MAATERIPSHVPGPLAGAQGPPSHKERPTGRNVEDWLHAEAELQAAERRA